MKILFFSFVTHFGGSHQATVAIGDGLKGKADFFVLDAYGVCDKYLAAIKDNNINYGVVMPQAKYVYIGGKNKIHRIVRMAGAAIEAFSFVKKLRKAINNINPDIIYVTTNKDLFYLSLAIGGKYPIVFFAHTENACPSILNYFHWKYVKGVLGVSNCCLNKFRSGKYKKDITAVIPNGIDIEKVRQAADIIKGSIPEKKGLTVLIPASLCKNKNQELAIRGLRDYIDKNGKQAYLWLCGNTAPGASQEYANFIHKIVKELQLEQNVEFLGWRDDVSALMQAVDIVALVSFSESFGRVFIEAMALGKPVIGTNVGGISEVIINNVNGLLCYPNKPESFSDALVELMNDYDVLSNNGVKMVVNFEINKIAYDFKNFTRLVLLGK